MGIFVYPYPIPMSSSQSSTINEKIEATLAKVADADHLTPGLKLVYDMRTGKMLYMSPAGLLMLGITLEDIQEVGSEQNRKFFNVEQSSQYTPQLFDLLRSSPTESLTFFQQASSEGTDWKWYLSVIQVLLKDEDNVPILSLTIAHHIDPKGHLTPQVARMIEEQNFIHEHQYLFNLLGEREQLVLSLIGKGASNQEMAEELHISVSTVETHRKNIRKKLKATTNAELIKYAQAFDLI